MENSSLKALKIRLEEQSFELQYFAAVHQIDLQEKPLSLLYSNYEVEPVKEYFDKETKKSFCEVCESDEADFWSVYGRFITGGAQCVADCKDEATAGLFYEKCTAALKYVRGD